jgi:hypothetical protein
MSSTSKQIWEAKKLSEKIKKGEHPFPQSSAISGASAEQLTTQQQKIDVPDDAVVEGMRKETAPVIEEPKVTDVIKDREHGQVVGKKQKHKLKEYFDDPTTAAEEKTALDDRDLTPAEKQTKLTEDQEETEGVYSQIKSDHPVKEEEDKYPSAKQTKISEEQETSEVAKVQKGEDKGGDKDDDDDDDDDKEDGETKTKVVKKQKNE